MKVRAALLSFVLAPALGGCGVYREGTSAQFDTSGNWRRVATDADRERLRNWRKAWSEALPLARAVAAAAAIIDGDPALFDPDRAQAGAMPPAGAYHCRTYKLGGGGTAVSVFTVYDWRPCSVEAQGNVRHFRIAAGAQRPDGVLFPDTKARVIFIGTLTIGDETAPLRYGIDMERNMLGYVERIGAARWRLVLPYPRFESMLDVVEIAPAE